MSLVLVGLGVSLDLTLKGLGKCKNADEIYLEAYTNLIPQEKISEIEKLVSKKLVLISRDKVESRFLIEQAKGKNICLLVSGDPLIATTHVTLLIDAKNKGIECKVIHNSSIYSVAPAISGLQIYRFGKTATLVNPRSNYRPISSLEIIRENLLRNLHTLVLLDTEPEPMKAKAALQMLEEFRGKDAIIISRASWTNQKITYGKITDLENDLKKAEIDFGEPPFTIIIPAKLHPLEEEFLNKFKTNV